MQTLFIEACQAYIAARNASDAASTEDLKRFGMVVAALVGCVALYAVGSVGRGYCVERSRIRAARAASAAHVARVMDESHRLLDASSVAEARAGAGAGAATTGETTYGSAAATTRAPAATWFSRLGLCCVRTAKAPYVAGEVIARWQEGIEMTDMSSSSVARR